MRAEFRRSLGRRPEGEQDRSCRRSPKPRQGRECAGFRLAGIVIGKLTYDRIGCGVMFNALGGDGRDYPSRDLMCCQYPSSMTNCAFASLAPSPDNMGCRGMHCLPRNQSASSWIRDTSLFKESWPTPWTADLRNADKVCSGCGQRRQSTHEAVRN